MKFKTLFFVVALFFISFTFVEAQQKNQCPCCTSAHDEFNFWLGEWTVYDINDKVVGTNKITKEYNNCVMKEDWKSTGVSRGTSYNYYDAKEKTWNQLWVDNSGFNLTLKGSYIDGKMVLKSALVDGEKGKYYNQITWKLNEDKSVTQVWEIFSEQEKLMQEVFRGIYKKTVK